MLYRYIIVIPFLLRYCEVSWAQKKDIYDNDGVNTSNYLMLKIDSIMVVFSIKRNNLLKEIAALKGAAVHKH